MLLKKNVVQHVKSYGSKNFAGKCTGEECFPNVGIQSVRSKETILKLVIVMCSAQKQVFHCKLRHQGYSSTQGRSSTTNTGTKVGILLAMDRCGSSPFISAPYSLFSI